MTVEFEECEYEPCHEPAVGRLVRPFKGDRVALCVTHIAYARALLEELAAIDQEELGR